MDTPLFYIFLFLHLISLIVGFGAVIMIDFSGLLWTFKRIKLSFLNRVADITQRLIWLGWFGLVISGLVLILHKGFVDNLTWIKLMFVAMLGVNGIFLHIIKKQIDKVSDEQPMPVLVRFRITMASITSQLGWWGAFSIGFVHRHIQHVINWPQYPFAVGGLIILILLAAWGMGEFILRKKL